MTKIIQGNKNIEQSSMKKFLTELTPDSSTENSLWKVTKYVKEPIAQVLHIRYQQMEEGPITV
jgi:hypothetical protein